MICLSHLIFRRQQLTLSFQIHNHNSGFLTSCVLYFYILFSALDLCFVKEVIGQCSSTSTYGCYHCKVKKDDWVSNNRSVGTAKNLLKMKEDGDKAQRVLGEDPNHDSKEFKAFQKAHFGQWVCSYVLRFENEYRTIHSMKSALENVILLMFPTI